MAVIKNGLTIIRNYETKDWKKGLNALQLAINCTKHKTTNVSPIKALTGRQCAVPAELLTLINEDEGIVNRNQLDDYITKKIDVRSTQDKLRFDKGKAKVKRFEKGEIVLFKTNPRNQIGLDLKYPDAYEIKKILPNDRYQIKRIVGRGRPKKVSHEQLRLAPKPNENSIVQDPVSALEDLSIVGSNITQVEVADQNFTQNTNNSINSPED
ncbi:retroelement polyprotein [Danaus plexippus plexippus]|uniref:Retroelement polyprotein n=1 Tax=Danaus plexippus plexippus TaxID=278856 RepID=A0A212F3R5_DANPL|nr:retroelement polyprotein [Danaus plexippus plexippus]